MDKKNIFKLVVVVLLVSTQFIVRAQSLSLSVSAKTIGKQDVVEATYSFQVINSPQNIAPDFRDWNVVGSNTSYETNLVNNQSSVSVNYIFDLMPKRSGKVDVPGISVNVGGKQLTCSPVSVNVSTKAHLNEDNSVSSNNSQDAFAAMQQQMQQQMAAMMQSMNNNFVPSGVSIIKHNGESLEQAVKDKIFIRVIPSKTTCYIGEPITVDYEVYISTSLTQNPQPVRVPTFDGFSVTDVSSQDANQRIVQLNGRNYEAASFRRSQLVPLKTGDLQLDVAEIKFQFNYEDASNAGSIKVGSAFVKSNPITIHVLPLPTKNKPANFSGAIGNFSIAASVSKYVLPAQETNNLHLQISGVGTLNGVTLPKILFPSIIQSYDAKDSQTIDKSQLPMITTLSFDVPFLGNEKGNAVIPPINFSYFNTQKGDYETIATYSIKLAFSAPIANTITVDNDNSKYLWIAGCIVVLVLLFLILIFINKRKSKRLSEQQRNFKKENSIQTTAENAVTVPVSEHDEEAIALEKKEKLKEILLDLELENSDHQFFVLAKALVIQYLQDELHTNSSNEQELLQQLQTKNSIKATEVADIFSHCNKALYMPVVPATEQNEVLKKIKLLIN